MKDIKYIYLELTSCVNVRTIMYRQSSVKKPTSKNTSSNNTFHSFTLFTYVTHINPG